MQMFTMLKPCPPEECVYKLIEPPKQIPPPGPPLYRSLFSRKVREDHYSGKCPSRTMGVPKVWPNSPHCYLKKHSLAPISIQRTVPKLQMVKDCQTETDNQDAVKDHCAQSPAPCEEEVQKEWHTNCHTHPKLCQCLGHNPKPAVPPPHTPFTLVPAGSQDFIAQNARNAIRQMAAKPAPRYVDDCHGTTHQWWTSGLPRVYVNGGNFGKVPGYLEGVRQHLYEQDQLKRDEVREKRWDMEDKCRLLEPHEREAISKGLKKNWEETFALYQSLPLNIDTLGKVKRKSGLEKELKRLELDIQLIERHEHVFVADTGRSFYLA